MQNTVLILDFGSQYTQLIARRVRELNVFCEIHPYHNLPENPENYQAVILSGSSASVHSENAPIAQLSSFLTKIPVLGIGYGAQLLAHMAEGEIAKAEKREYRKTHLQKVDQTNKIFQDLNDNFQVWYSLGDKIKALPASAQVLAQSVEGEIAAFQLSNENTFGFQFHPEVHHTTQGKKIIENFLINIANIVPTWTPQAFVDNSIKKLKEDLQNDKVVLGLSGGVDSTVTAVILNKAIGKNLFCIFVNHGLLRKNEFENVLHQYKDMGLNVKGVDASERFLTALKDVSDPEEKRKIIGRTFIEVFDDEAHQISDVKWLAQGTIYPDVVESVSADGKSVAVKSHHNVGGLPDFMKLSIVEPLRMLFKDEVRRVGKELGIHPDLLGRHPFPGPGLAIRILGDITAEKVRILQEVDAIFINQLREWNLYDNVWQAGAILLPINSVGVSGDERTYERVVALRAVNSVDGMTADIIPLPYEFLQDVSNKIINEVNGVNRVVYDISSKPPATIEWE
ncbi:MAG TPA: glutamine-hydrolyzing GMP synthase [Flavobacteriaceae bacterium]|nr:glutamine-hydrolyzing GMP synthase [Flavobacteriaceae bacterium]